MLMISPVPCDQIRSTSDVIFVTVCDSTVCAPGDAPVSCACGVVAVCADEDVGAAVCADDGAVGDTQHVAPSFAISHGLALQVWESCAVLSPSEPLQRSAADEQTTGAAQQVSRSCVRSHGFRLHRVFLFAALKTLLAPQNAPTVFVASTEAPQVVAALQHVVWSETFSHTVVLQNPPPSPSNTRPSLQKSTTFSTTSHGTGFAQHIFSSAC